MCAGMPIVMLPGTGCGMLAALARSPYRLGQRVRARMGMRVWACLACVCIWKPSMPENGRLRSRSSYSVTPKEKTCGDGVW